MLRGLLAAWVVAFHALTISGSWTSLPDGVRRALDGSHAVDVFIVLSGFVITLLVVGRREAYPVFVTRRWLRLFPVYVVCLALSLGLQALGAMPSRVTEGDLPAHLLAHLTMLHGAVPDGALPGAAESILNPAWSVSLEWQFYLIAPAWIRLMSSGRRGLLAGTLLAILGYRFVSPGLSGFTWAFLLERVHLFWVGIASASLFVSPASTRDRLAVVAASTCAAALFLPYLENVGLWIWLASFATLVAGSEGRALPRSLLWLGAVSYPLYLVHEPLQWLAVFLWPGIGGLVLLAVSLPAGLAAAALLHRGVEAPFMRLGRSLGRPGDAVAP